jgi:SAM-dependent methyltransferase
VDPRVLLEEDPSPEDFRDAMTIIHVGETIKITGTNRHGAADALLLDNVDLAGASIVDLGASDGSTSAELLAKLPEFGSYVIADLYLSLRAVELGRSVVFFDAHGTCVLIAGRRLLAWPSLARTVRLLAAPLILRARRRPVREVQLLGPGARRWIRDDPRVTARVHDVFQPWPAPAPDVIKVANLLRRLYFSDEEILRALQALLDSLGDGGHLLILDNPRVAGIDLRAGLYRRRDGRFEAVAETPESPEIADLLRSPKVAVS